jgi:hypothetical protein
VRRSETFTTNYCFRVMTLAMDKEKHGYRQFVEMTFKAYAVNPGEIGFVCFSGFGFVYKSFKLFVSV